MSDFVETIQYNRLKECNSSKTFIEKVSNEIFKLQDSSIDTKINQIVKLLGGHIEVVPELGSHEGSILIKSRSDFNIRLPKSSSPLRDRFTIAHELGHYILHYVLQNREDNAMAERFGDSRIEREANWFAAELLMPQKEVLNLWKNGKTILQLASHFNVSFSAMQVRIKSIGCN